MVEERDRCAAELDGGGDEARRLNTPNGRYTRDQAEIRTEKALDPALTGEKKTLDSNHISSTKSPHPDNPFITHLQSCILMHIFLKNSLTHQMLAILSKYKTSFLETRF